MTESGTLLDDVIPTYDVASRHRVWVAASPARVYQVARQVDLRRPWPVRVLMGLRLIPGSLATVLRAPRRAATFTLIAESPGEEFVLGIMGRFWTPTGGVVPASPDSFRHPPPAGLAQGIWNFRVQSSGGGTELSTETRVRCGDEAARRQFRRYWRIIRLGSGVIRRSVLRHIRLTAEGRLRGRPPESRS
jgi:hypothetical protein